MSDYKYIGRSVPIHDAQGKVTGSLRYAGDMVLPGMLHLALLTCDIPHGIVKSIRTERALALDGVVDVLHCFNTTKERFNRYRNIHGQKLINQEEIFPERVRFVGDRVACVIAETPQAARAALPLIEVEYERLPYATDAKTVIESGVLDDMFEDGAVYPAPELINGEQPDLTGTTITQTQAHFDRQSHVTMEPQACIADYDPLTGQATVYSPNQSVNGLRTVLADLFDLPYHKMRVVKTTMGGSFGSKQEWMAEPVALAAALHTGRPVKIVFTREQAMLSTITRAAFDGKMTTHVTPEGKVLSVDIETVIDAGAYLSNSLDYCIVVSSKIFRCYTFPYVRYNGKAVCTNSPVSGAFRSWGTAELYLLVEHHFNELARKLGMDATDFRLKNIVKLGDVDKKTGVSLGDVRIGDCIKQGREKFGWFAKRQAAEAFNAQNGRFLRGVGIGCGGHGNTYFPRREDFGAAQMRVSEDGTVLVNISLHDHGCGTVTAFQMMIAETLTIPIDQVAVGEADSSVTPFDLGCFASRTTYVLGRIAVDCAEKLKDLLVATIAKADGSEPEAVKIQGGQILAGDKHYSFADAAQYALHTLQQELTVMHQFVADSNPGVTGAHFAHVEVDTKTGMVAVLDYLAMHDIGKVINREITVAQIQGAVAMGTGCALTERMTPNKNGRFTSSLKDYHLRNCPEAPDVEVEFVEADSIGGPFGAKSIGELSLVPVAPAIMGAVNDALDASLSYLPLTPDRILKHLANGGESR
ncbi:MAG: molybdopterin-dependent oxidoreductase [Oscillospiraceae bacterium]|nr:molybdopterin-dependent oxidoreductase [Oscillospiraceae bacterium]